MSSTPVESPTSITPTTASKVSNRLPSLNQLAARINSNSGATANINASTTSAPRPRLPAFALRTGSNASLSTTASTNDSTAVNFPNTRSTSPSALSTPPPLSTTPTNETGDTGEALTAERLEKLNLETVAPLPEKKTKVGYKNIPSLDAITARLGAKARQLSVDGSAKPPEAEAEFIEDPKTPGVPMKKPEHPLQYPWTIYHDTKAKFPYIPGQGPAGAPQPLPQQPPSASGDGTYQSLIAPPESTDYEAGLTVIGEFSTVEEFCRYFNWLKPPSKLERNSNYHLFKSGIKPMWEDPANAKGGKWVLTMKNNPVLLDRCWSWLAMALIGEELEDGDEICGAVVSLRSKVDRIQVWTRSKEDVERLNAIGKRLVKLLDISEADSIGLEFQYNTDDRPMANKFLSIQSMPTTSYRATFQASAPPSAIGPTKTLAAGLNESVPASAGPALAGAAFGSFGMGIGGGWKGPKRA